MSINRVNVSGNITRDPVLKRINGGTDVLLFGLAINDRRRDRDSGEWVDAPNFVDCAVFGSRADALAKILRKGTKVALEGKLRSSHWQDKQSGQGRSKVEIAVSEVELMQRAPQQADAAQAAPAAQAASARTQQTAPASQTPSWTPGPMQAAPSVYDEDVPF